MVQGADIYDPSSGFLRCLQYHFESAQHQLHRVRHSIVFDVNYSLPTHGRRLSHARSRVIYSPTATFVGAQRDGLGCYLRFVCATPMRSLRERLPSFLYQSCPENSIAGYE